MVMASQQLRDVSLGKNPMIRSITTIDPAQIQPASFDCRLGKAVIAVSGSGIPGADERVEDFARKNWRYDFELSSGKTNLLQVGQTYLIRLMEELSLAENYCAVFSPKSSVGRCDVFVRVVSDRCSFYDRTPFGYSGPLYAEVTPLSFDVRVGEGLSLVQMRLKTKQSKVLSNDKLVELHAKHGVVRHHGQIMPHGSLRVSDNSIYFRIDLRRPIVGFEARTRYETLDLTRTDHDPRDFWNPIRAPRNGDFFLDPERFYLFVTEEGICIPPECCGEIAPYDTASGEFRAHYAGFFDNGFGGEMGTVGVLEVRANKMRFRISHGQPVCRMTFENTFEVPDRLYAKEGQNNYGGYSPSLSKFFKDRQAVWDPKYWNL